jgi:hypothetical protein
MMSQKIPTAIRKFAKKLAESPQTFFYKDISPASAIWEGATLKIL